MTRLLVSVRDAAETQIALRIGVDLLDLKEPHHGPLGAVDGATVDEVLHLVAGRVPVSIAMGELLDLPRDARSSLAISRSVNYFKLGLTNCAASADWISRWRQVIEAAPPPAAPVAVIYADGASVAAPGVDEILEAATIVGCRTVLVDTAIKNGRGLLDHWSPTVLRQFLVDARQRKLTTVIGGGLTLDTIPQVAEIGPDYVAVRGAACAGPRTGMLDAAALQSVRHCLVPKLAHR